MKIDITSLCFGFKIEKKMIAGLQLGLHQLDKLPKVSVILIRNVMGLEKSFMV